MAHVKVDFDMLTVALESGHTESDWYLDLETGEVISFFDSFGDDEVEREQVEDNPERYRYIDPIDSHDGFRIMQDFAATLPESEAKRALARSLNRKSPFRNFKDDLYEFPDVQKKWYDFHNAALLQMAKEWLQSEQIDTE